MLKEWLFLGAGMAIGAGIGVLAVRSHYRKLAFDEINEARDVFRKMAVAKEAASRNDEMKRKMQSDNSGEEGNSGDKTGKTGIESPKNAENGKKKQDFQRYSELSKPYLEGQTGKTGKTGMESGNGKEAHNVFSNPPDPDQIDISDDSDEPYADDEDNDPYELTVSHESPRDGYSAPYRITEEEFASEKFTYDKVMIEYYMNDNIAVLEDSDQVIDCIEDLIGPDILDEVDGTVDDGDEVYVRNDSRSSDYGIIFIGTDYVPEEGLQD